MKDGINGEKCNVGLLLSRWKVDPYFKVFVLRGFGVKVEGLFVVVIIVNNGKLFSLLCFFVIRR